MGTTSSQPFLEGDYDPGEHSNDEGSEDNIDIENSGSGSSNHDHTTKLSPPQESATHPTTFALLLAPKTSPTNPTAPTTPQSLCQPQPLLPLQAQVLHPTHPPPCHHLHLHLYGLLFGYQMGVTGRDLHTLQSTLSLTALQAKPVSNFFFLRLMIASPFGGYTCNLLGRCMSIFFMDRVFGVAAAIMVVAPNYTTMLAGRFLVGCTSDISLMAAVSYLTKLVSTYHHHAHCGVLVLTGEVAVSLGFLASYLALRGGMADPLWGQDGGLVVGAVAGHVEDAGEPGVVGREWLPLQGPPSAEEDHIEAGLGQRHGCRRG
ncbi:hypothetical protein ACHAXS_001690 [Conticribra weissflogii]